MLLVDQSGSMQRAPGAAIVRALDALATELPDDTRYALIGFAESPQLIENFRAGRPRALDGLAFDGQWTDLAAGVERSLYQLRNGAAEDQPKALVIVSDGRIDLPSEAAEASSERWLLGTLADDARRAGVLVVALVPPGTQADYRILQGIVRPAGGRYALIDATDPAAAGRALGAQIVDALLTARPAQAEAAEKRATPAPSMEPPERPAALPAPAVRAVPIEPAPDGRRGLSDGARIRISAGLALLAILAACAAWLIWRRSRPQALDNVEYFPECYLLDLEQITGEPRIPLRGRVNLVTRMNTAPEPGMHLILIPDRHIGRRHAVIEFRHHAFWLRDLKSLNGTYVNGQRLTGETQLRHGNFVRFHKFEFQFCDAHLAVASETEYEPRPANVV